MIVEIQDAIRSYHPNPDFDIIRRAYVFAWIYHKDQKRLSGEPFISHPLAVAKILTELKADDKTVTAGLLHDTVEDTPATLEEIKKHFGKDIAFLVDGVTKLSKADFKVRDERQAENLRRMLIFMAKDIRVIIIKLTDRLDNIRTAEYLPQDKREEMALETIEIFAPTAHRLGMYNLKIELEDIAFSILKPDIAKMIKAHLKEAGNYRQKYIDENTQKLKRILAREGIKAEVQGRLKGIYSIYKKVLREGIDIADLHDVIAFRVIVPTVKDCYQALGVIHSKLKPVPGRFKDYIAMPKFNGYRAIHTTVIGDDGQKMEIQIRDEKMHREAEEGIAAHWMYKSDTPIDESELKRFSWVKTLLEMSRKTLRFELIEEVKEGLFPDEIYVFTPKGDVKILPKGATALDFAYAVHTDLGERCQGAKVNGKLQPIDYKLQNGDMVEIIISKTQKPKRSWLDIVKTQKARSKIRSFIRKEEKEMFKEIGEDTLRKELRKHGLRLDELLRREILDEAAQKLNVRTIDDLFTLIGYGKIAPSTVVKKIIKGEKEEEKEERERELIDLKDVMIRFAQCCNPVPGDKLLGYITRGKGIMIHTASCLQLMSLDPDRLIEVDWLRLPDEGVAKIEVTAEERAIEGVTSAILKGGSKIEEMTFKKDGMRMVGNILIAVKDKSQLDKVIKSIESVEGVVSADRV